MAFFEKDNSRIYYETRGEQGPWLTLVNGYTRTHRDFKLIAKRLSEKNQVLIFDNRGSGSTTTPPGFSIEDMGKDIVDLWSHLGIRRSHLLGISMGGLIAQFVAANFPDLVQFLILASTFANPKWLNPSAESPWGDSIESISSKMSFYFSSSFHEKNKLLVQAMAKQILKAIEEGDFGDGAQDQRMAINSFNPDGQAQKIAAPTLVIHGSEDRIVDVDAAHEISDLIPNCTLEIVEGAGHLLLAEYAKGLETAIKNFII